MKNILLLLVFMLAIVTAEAQRKIDRSENRRELATNLNPGDLASIQAKRMTLALDLSDNQEKEIVELLIAERSYRKDNKITREHFKAMSADQILTLKENTIDEKIAIKRAFKKILNDEQYTEFEKMAKKKNRERHEMRQKVHKG
jgi:LAS superfamily LD-carboxypeptidase LdcB